MNNNNKKPNPFMFWFGLAMIIINVVLIVVYVILCPGRSLLEVDGIFGPAFWGFVCILMFSHQVAKYNEGNNNNKE